MRSCSSSALRVGPVELGIPSASLRAGSSLRLKNGCAQDDNRIDGSVHLVRTDDSGYGAGSGRGRPLYVCIFCVEHVEIFQAGASVEEDYCVFWSEEAAG